MVTGSPFNAACDCWLVQQCSCAIPWRHEHPTTALRARTVKPGTEPGLSIIATYGSADNNVAGTLRCAVAASDKNVVSHKKMNSEAAHNPLLFNGTAECAYYCPAISTHGPPGSRLFLVALAPRNLTLEIEPAIFG